MPDRAGARGVLGLLARGPRPVRLAAMALAAGWHIRVAVADGPGVWDAADREKAGSEADGWEADGWEADGWEAVESIEALAAGASLVIVEDAADEASQTRLVAALDVAASADIVLALVGRWPSVETRAAATRHPERILGLHHAADVPGASLVEIVAGQRSSSVAIEAAHAFVASLGLGAIVCGDVPGLVVDRVGRPYLVEAVRMLEAGQGTVPGIDAALEAAGYACGPFRLLDRIGLDVDLGVGAVLVEAHGEALRFASPRLQADLVAAGRLGRDRGQGFYRYPSADRPDPEAGLAPPVPLPVGLPQLAPPSVPLSPERILERIELGVINEAYRAVGDGVCGPDSVDLAMRLGGGHPSGPFELVDRLGLRAIVERLRVLDGESGRASGGQYEVAPLLWQMATI